VERGANALPDLLFPARLVRQNSAVQTGYRLVHLRNGVYSVRSLAEDETFHPGIGPVAEAEALYVRQLGLPERVRETREEFVIWDVGLGGAANALTAIRSVSEALNGRPARLRMISFDRTSDALAFALEHVDALRYPAGFEVPLAELVQKHSAKFGAGTLEVEWDFVIGDFPALLAKPPLKTQNSKLLPPHAVLFDPHSPGKNPAMWTASLFAGLFRRLDPQRPCSLATFTRSTMVRAALLLGGFFVGVGHPSGLKEETTVAANRSELLDEPLGRRWLERAQRSAAAEPLGEPLYRQAPLSPETRERLQRHSQFSRTLPSR